MYRYLIVYLKPNNKLVYKLLKHKPQYKVGEKNQYEWIVVDIKNVMKNKCYSPTDYVRKKKMKHLFLSFTNIFTQINYSKIIEISLIIYIMVSNFKKLIIF